MTPNSVQRLVAVIAGSVTLGALAAVSGAQETIPADPDAKRGVVFSRSTDPNAPWTIDPRDVGKPWDPSLSELERLEALIRHRKKTGRDELDCQFGPVDRRISKERLVDLFETMRAFKLTGAESWELLRAEPDDYNEPPITITIPADDGGPNCPDGDLTGKLFAERRRLIEEERRTSSGSTPRRSNPAVIGGPVVIDIYSEWISDLDRTEAIMLHRAGFGLDRLPDCYYGPVQMHIPLGRVNALLKESPDLTGEEYWRWFTAQPPDPKLPPLTILVRSGTLPGCAAGDVDERLLRERARLWKERSAAWSAK